MGEESVEGIGKTAEGLTVEAVTVRYLHSDEVVVTENDDGTVLYARPRYGDYYLKAQDGYYVRAYVVTNDKTGEKEIVCELERAYVNSDVLNDMNAFDKYVKVEGNQLTISKDIFDLINDDNRYEFQIELYYEGAWILSLDYYRLLEMFDIQEDDWNDGNDDWNDGKEDWGDGEITEEDTWVDVNCNGKFDEEDYWEDLNGNGIFDGKVPGAGNGENTNPDNGEVNEDGTDPEDGKEDWGENTDPDNGEDKWGDEIIDETDTWVDVNGNGKFDEEDAWKDLNGNGIFDGKVPGAGNGEATDPEDGREDWGENTDPDNGEVNEDGTVTDKEEGREDVTYPENGKEDVLYPEVDKEEDWGEINPIDPPSDGREDWGEVTDPDYGEANEDGTVTDKENVREEITESEEGEVTEDGTVTKKEEVKEEITESEEKIA